GAPGAAGPRRRGGRRVRGRGAVVVSGAHDGAPAHGGDGPPVGRTAARPHPRQVRGGRPRHLRDAPRRPRVVLTGRTRLGCVRVAGGGVTTIVGHDQSAEGKHVRAVRGGVRPVRHRRGRAAHPGRGRRGGRRPVPGGRGGRPVGDRQGPVRRVRHRRRRPPGSARVRPAGPDPPHTRPVTRPPRPTRRRPRPG